jgi:hypothetical protein
MTSGMAIARISPSPVWLALFLKLTYYLDEAIADFRGHQTGST